jgi:hypothetical protein
VPTYPIASFPRPHSAYIDTIHFSYKIWGKIGEELGRKNIKNIRVKHLGEKKEK